MRQDWVVRDRNLLLTDPGLWAISRSTTLPLSVSHHACHT